MKLKTKTKKAIRGSVSVLLVIILLPMMTFSAVVVDMSRINMAKEMMSSAGDLTMNTALANYDTILKDVYGLFAMSQEKTEAELATDLRNYFAETISGYGVVSEAEAGDYVDALLGDFNVLLSDTGEYQNNSVTDFLKLENLTLTADRVDASALANSSILRNQIVEYMKFRAPLEFGMSFLDSLKSFDVADEQMDVVEAQVTAQEGTQDVTTACSNLIKLIREYDDLVKSINSGDKAVKGVDNSADQKTVAIKDYDTQVDKYLDKWQENYTHINKLNMIFLAKAPSVNEVYLVQQDFSNGEYFIKSDGSDVVYNNCGISISVATKNDVTEAKNAVTQQIDVLNGLENTATTYEGKSFIDKSFIKSDKSDFTDEGKAIATFIDYEKFLLNQSSDVKYSDVKNVLEQIYTLAKLYDHYYSKITDKINTAYANLNSAKTTLRGINSTISNSKNAMQGYVDSINTTVSDFVGDDQDFNYLDKAGTTNKSSAKNLLGSELPDISGDYNAYYNNYLSSASNNNVYQNLYKKVADKLKTSGSTSEKTVANAALEYLNKGSGSADGLKNYLKDTKNVDLVAQAVTGDLRGFFVCLYRCSSYVTDYKNQLDQCNTAEGQKTEAEQVVREKQAIYDGLVQERSDVESSYTESLNGFKSFVKAYQEDAYYYGVYITTATNIIDRETKAVSDQFGKICSNINELKTKLSAISTQAGVVKTQIEAYLEKLDSWESSKNTYESNNGADSFSKQTATDIATARSNYDLDSLATLQTFVTDLHNRYNTFYTYLQGDVYLKYGGKRLHEINNAEDAKSAASSNIQSISEEIVTEQIATTSLGQLYKSAPGTEFKPYTMEMTYTAEQVAASGGAVDTEGQLCFLEKTTIQIQFLKYLNSAYPESVSSKAVKDEDGNVVEEDAEADYEATKDELKTPKESIDDMGEDATEAPAGGEGDSDSSSSEETTVKTDKYGYSYKAITLSDTDKANRPSKDKVTSKAVDNKAFALSEDTEKASGSVNEQGKGLDKVLSGLGSALTAGLENAYILTYIFENFSYNTMIQDAVMEGEKDQLESGTMTASLSTAQGLLKGETLENYKDKQQTLSGITKRAANNYLYGAEIEYIMYGNASPAKNVSYAKASIYAIRFCFNSIYAFTNTEIRNTTMAAGLAVQAATLGIVPYQVVQIVLQLALAAAESAVDLEMMMTGLDVAVVKTKDTWSLSLTNAVKTAGSLVAEAGADAAGKAINKVSGGLQQIVDASADELNGIIKDLKDDLSNSTRQAVTDVVDQAFGVVMNEIEKVLNEIQYVELTAQETLQGWVNTQFNQLQSGIESTLRSTFAGSEIATKVVDVIIAEGYINTVLTEVKGKIDTAIADTTQVGSSAVERVISQMNDIKMAMINKVTTVVEGVLTKTASIANEAVAGVQGQLDSYISQTGEKLSEEAAKSIREGVTNATNNFVNNYLGDAVGASGGSGGSSVASLIKFGYKEYMMLFVYIAICAGGTSENNNILLRTADLIQLNIAHAGSGASFSHKKGSGFLMKNACTYVSINAEAELDMFFLDLDLFASVLEEDTGDGTSATTTAETESNTATKIKYKGLLGY